MTGVSFVVPVHNGAAHITDTVASIAAQADGRPLEIIVVEDRSTDGSAAVLRSLARAHPLTIVNGPGRGAAAAVNAGIRMAAHPIVCQVDQDVVLEPGWMTTLVAALHPSTSLGTGDPAVAAAQGCYVTDARASFFARVMALDLEQRYASLAEDSDHVCTGNTAYRASALREAGPLDESLGYGYDNDLSYRLRAAGYRLAFCGAARSRHHWREGFTGYLAQQYGFGYGRLDVVSRHPRRVTGDAVSPAGMMAHPLILGVAVMLLAFGAVAAGAALIGLLAVERAIAGVRAWRMFGDPAALAFPVVHLARDAAWLAAVAVWTVRRVTRRPVRPEHSMIRRSPA